MKTAFTLFTLLLAGGITWISTHEPQTVTGPHGGRIKEAGSFTVELLSSYPDLYAFLLNKELKPVSNKGVACVVKFFLPDNTSEEAVMKPYDEDGFVTGVINPGCVKYRITFNVFGKRISADFTSEHVLAVK